jgi:hypothetical protein
METQTRERVLTTPAGELLELSRFIRNAGGDFSHAGVAALLERMAAGDSFQEAFRTLMDVFLCDALRAQAAIPDPLKPGDTVDVQTLHPDGGLRYCLAEIVQLSGLQARVRNLHPVEQDWAPAVVWWVRLDQLRPAQQRCPGVPF